MNVKTLIKKLSKFDPNMEIVGIEEYDRMLSNKIKLAKFEHNGLEAHPFNSEMVFKSNIPAGNYLIITFK